MTTGRNLATQPVPFGLNQGWKRSRVGCYCEAVG